jgi:hypothetical protein
MVHPITLPAEVAQDRPEAMPRLYYLVLEALVTSFRYREQTLITLQVAQVVVVYIYLHRWVEAELVEMLSL